jgi:hypothetical protein
MAEKTKTAYKIWAERHPEKVKEINRINSGKLAVKVAKKKWRINNPIKQKELDLKWTKEHPSYHSDYNKRYNGTLQVKARSKASYFIIIPENQLCQECGNNLATQKHHDNYNNPLEVKFVCDECHVRKRETLMINCLKGGNISKEI